MKKILNAAMILFIVSLSCLAQEKKIYQETVHNWLSSYLSVKDDVSDMPSSERILYLKNQGIDPFELSMELLSDVQYAEFWLDSFNLFAYPCHQEGKDVFLAEKLIEILERNEIDYPRQVILNKVLFLSFLLQMVGPNYFQDEVLKGKIIQYADSFFESKNPTEPQYWITKFHLEKYVSLPVESRSEETSDRLRKAESLAVKSVSFAGYLYYATNDNKYLDILNKAKNSNNIRIQNKANFILSDRAKSSWISGRYELFANVNLYRPSPEDIERMKQMNGNTRTNKETTSNK